MILTGGTISMNKHSDNELIDISDDYTKMIDELKDKLNGIDLSYEVFSMLPSPHLKITDMFSLTKLIDLNINDDAIDGIVITHGTDTLEETAYMADLYIKSKKPVIFTGSMRSYSDISYDGIRNLLSAILVAASDDSKNQGVLVVLNDEINSAAEVTKTHTLSLDTFKSLDFGPLGIIDNQSVIFYRKSLKNTKHIRPNTLNANVEIIKISAGTSSLLLNLLINHGVDGIVIESLGRGNISIESLPGVTRAIENSIPLVLTSRVPMGRVLGTYGYEGGGGHLEKLGVIFAPNLNSQKARIKLMMILSLTHKNKTGDYFL